MAGRQPIQLYPDEREYLDRLKKRLLKDKTNELGDKFHIDISYPKLVMALTNEKYRFYPIRFNTNVNELFIIRRKKKNEQ